MYGSEILSKNSAKLLYFFFKKKLGYLKSKISTKFHRLLFLFIFLAFLAFFFLFYLSMVFNKIVKFCVVILYGSKILWKNSTKLSFVCQKKLRYLKSKISTKFHHLLFLFYFFSIFGILFSVSPMQTCSKIMEFLLCCIGRVRDFTSDFYKILKVLFKEILICEIIFF